MSEPKAKRGSVKQEKRRLSMAIRQQAADSGVGHLVGAVETSPEQRGLSMSMQIKVRLAKAAPVIQANLMTMFLLCY